MIRRRFCRISAAPFPGQLVAIIVSFIFWSNETAAAPPAGQIIPQLESAIRAAQDTDHGTPEQISQSAAELEPVVENPLLKPWGLLYRGILYERLKKPAQAFADYQAVPADSSPSIDAEAGTIRIQIQRLTDKPFSYEQLQSSVDRLLILADSVDRGDLKQELLFDKGRIEEELNQPSAALQSYRQLRRDFPQSRFRFLAGESSQKLRSKINLPKGETRAEDQLDEAQILLGEEEYVAALEELQSAAPQLRAGNPLLGKILLLEERILRKMGRASEADHLLERLAGSTTGGDEALLRIAKAAWAKDEFAAAREKLAVLLERFPASPLADEARYCDGRIYEEINMIPDAREEYRELTGTGHTPQFRIKGFKRLAWIAYRSGDYLGAAKEFFKMRRQVRLILTGDPALRPQKPESTRAGGKTAANLPLPLTRKERNDFADDYAHSSYWLAVSSAKLNSKQRSEIAGDEVLKLGEELAPEQIFMELASHPTIGYYSLRSAERLNKKINLGAAAAECRPPGSDPLLSLFGTGPFESSVLRPLAEKEIAWRYGPRLKPLDPLAGPEKDRAEFWRLSAERVGLVAAFGTPYRTVTLAHSATRTGSWEFAAGRSATPCIEAVVQAGFPRPYPDLFKQASVQYKISLPLLLAVSRTESHFDPNARSSAGALGLMQVMPNTAINEGMRRDENLIYPAVNIRLGAKHLAGLISENENLAQAIAAYNGGKPALAKWIARYPGLTSEEWSEQIGFPETLEYVKKVLFAAAIYGS